MNGLALVLLRRTYLQNSVGRILPFVSMPLFEILSIIINIVASRWIQTASSEAHSQMEHYFFSYLLTCDVYLIEVLEIMAQMLQYIYIFFKPESNKGEFRLYFELFEKKL